MIDSTSSQFEKLKKNRGRLIGMMIGSGMLYRYAEENDFSFIIIATVGRFRQMGVSSLSASMPYSNANRMGYDYAVQEIMPVYAPNIPVFFGLCATDPTTDIPTLLDQIKELGFAGICNIPTVLIFDGEYRAALEKAGFSYQKEVEAIQMAHEKGLLTIAMAQTREHADKMIQAGCDILCMHFGASKGGLLGAKKELSLEKATIMADDTFSAVSSKEEGPLLMFYGGPSKSPSSLRFLLSHTRSDGFIGGYSIERMMFEQDSSSASVKESFFSTVSLNPQHGKINLVEVMKENIEKYYPEKVCLNTIANELHVSRTYLSHVFQNEVGISFQEYLIRLRIEKAAYLLQSTTLPVREVGSAVGYEDVAQFSKMFKKRHGFSPLQYRQRTHKDKK